MNTINKTIKKGEGDKIYLYCSQCGRRYPLDRVYCPKCNTTLDFNNITIQY